MHEILHGPPAGYPGTFAMLLPRHSTGDSTQWQSRSGSSSRGLLQGTASPQGQTAAGAASSAASAVTAAIITFAVSTGKLQL